MILENLRKIFSQDPNTALKNTIDSKITTYDKIYLGEVKSTDDPEKRGRIKVAVHGILDQYQTRDIPWAYPESNFIGSKTGSMIIPPKGSLVCVRFQNGDQHLPIYLSSKVHVKDSLPKGSAGIDPNNLIFWETDNGDYFEIRKTEKEMELKHSSGTKLTISSTGTIKIHAWAIEDVSRSLPMVNPIGISGPFCAIPVCPYTNMSHVGHKAFATNPPIG